MASVRVDGVHTKGTTPVKKLRWQRGRCSENRNKANESGPSWEERGEQDEVGRMIRDVIGKDTCVLPVSSSSAIASWLLN